MIPLTARILIFACIKQQLPNTVTVLKAYADETSTIKTKKLLYRVENKDLESCVLLFRKDFVFEHMMPADWQMEITLFLSSKRSTNMLGNMLRQNIQMFQTD